MPSCLAHRTLAKAGKVGEAEYGRHFGMPARAVIS